MDRGMKCLGHACIELMKFFSDEQILVVLQGLASKYLDIERAQCFFYCLRDGPSPFSLYLAVHHASTYA